MMATSAMGYKNFVKEEKNLIFFIRFHKRKILVGAN